MAGRVPARRDNTIELRMTRREAWGMAWAETRLEAGHPRMQHVVRTVEFLAVMTVLVCLVAAAGIALVYAAGYLLGIFAAWVTM